MVLVIFHVSHTTVVARSHILICKEREGEFHIGRSRWNMADMTDNISFCISILDDDTFKLSKVWNFLHFFLFILLVLSS